MFWIIAVVVVAIDQFTKYIALSSMAELQSIPLIPNVFHLTLVLNPGAAFSLFANRTSFFIIVTLLAVFISVYFYYKAQPNTFLLRLGIAMQCGGAVGNLIDRIRLGRVVDFFDFRIWPVFNVADSAICVGVALICWELLRKRPEEEIPKGGTVKKVKS